MMIKSVSLFFLLASCCFAAPLYAKRLADSQSKLLLHQPIVKQADGHFFFEKNHGQAAKDILFFSRSKNYTLSITSRQAKLRLHGRAPVSTQSSPLSVIDLTFSYLQANAQASVQGNQPLASTSHYFLGNQPNQWITNVPHYQSVVQTEIYPHIDLVYRFHEGKLEYDFVVKTGGNPSDIRMAVNGADKIQLAADGSLELLTSMGVFMQHAPVVYQDIHGQRQRVVGKFVVRGNEIGFAVADYEASVPLVIDPVLSFSSYFGGSGKDNARAIVNDRSGNFYITGTTTETALVSNNGTQLNPAQFPIQDETQQASFQVEHGINDCNYSLPDESSNIQFKEDFDVFLSKFDPQGNLLFSTFFGGCGNEGARSMAIDMKDNIYLLGATKSANFPITPQAFQRVLSPSDDEAEQTLDLFISKLTSDGQLVYSTYFGGSKDERARGLDVDRQGRVYFVANTTSSGLAMPCVGPGGVKNAQVLQCQLSGGSDLIVGRLSSDGRVLSVASYLGGSADDFASGLVLEFEKDNDNNHNIVSGVYVAGTTFSDDLLGSESLPSYRKYYPGTGLCKIDKDVDLVDQRACSDGFLMKLSRDLEALIFRTYIGGDKDDEITAIALDDTLAEDQCPGDQCSGNLTYDPQRRKGVYIAGLTYSSGFMLGTGKPVAEVPEMQTQLASFPLLDGLLDSLGLSDSLEAFVTKFTRDGREIMMSTFVRGSDRDVATALVVKRHSKASSDVYVDEIFVGGHTLSQDFPIVNALQSMSLDSDVFLTKLLFDPDPAYKPAPPAPQKRWLRVDYSTLLGGESIDFLFGLTVNDDRQAYLAGGTWSKSMYVTDTAFQPQYGGGESDILLAKVSELERPPVVELDTSITVSHQNLHPGEVINYTVMVSNQGPDQAINARLSILLPQAATLLEWSKNYPCQFYNNVSQNHLLLCEIGLLGVTNASVVLKVTYRFSGNMRVRADSQSETSNVIRYGLNLMSLERADALPEEGRKLVVVAKIGDFYHVRIFDPAGEIVIDKGKGEFLPDSVLVQELNDALSAQLTDRQIDNQTQHKLTQKIISNLDYYSLKEISASHTLKIINKPNRGALSLFFLMLCTILVVWQRRAWFYCCFKNT